MAKLYILTKEQIENGTRPKTPREKQRNWRRVCIILTSLIVLEHLFALYWFR